MLVEWMVEKRNGKLALTVLTRATQRMEGRRHRSSVNGTCWLFQSAAKRRQTLLHLADAPAKHGPPIGVHFALKAKGHPSPNTADPVQK